MNCIHNLNTKKAVNRLPFFLDFLLVRFSNPLVVSKDYPLIFNLEKIVCIFVSNTTCFWLFKQHLFAFWWMAIENFPQLAHLIRKLQLLGSLLLEPEEPPALLMFPLYTLLCWWCIRYLLFVEQLLLHMKKASLLESWSYLMERIISLQASVQWLFQLSWWALLCKTSWQNNTCCWLECDSLCLVVNYFNWKFAHRFAIECSLRKAYNVPYWNLF